MQEKTSILQRVCHATESPGAREMSVVVTHRVEGEGGFLFVIITSQARFARARMDYLRSSYIVRYFLGLRVGTRRCARLPQNTRFFSCFVIPHKIYAQPIPASDLKTKTPGRLIRRKEVSYSPTRLGGGGERGFYSNVGLDQNGFEFCVIFRVSTRSNFLCSTQGAQLKYCKEL
jgi:hypothetical protein